MTTDTNTKITFSTQAVRSAVEVATAEVVVPEGVEISTELKQAFVDAGVRGTLNGLGALEGVGITYVLTDDAGADDLVVIEPSELLASYFENVNS